MKYGESTFDIIYLLYAIIMGFVILRKATNKTEKFMGITTLVLGIGDSFHLVPRVLNYFVEADWTMALGVGKLVTSLTMTVFYVLLYYIYLGQYKVEENRKHTIFIWALCTARVILCAFPQNGWITNDNGMTWGILRNVPFVILGAVIVILFFGKRREGKSLRFMWLLITLSFLFYIPVAVFAGIIPLLGMLMLPKTICYMLMIFSFSKVVGKGASD